MGFPYTYPNYNSFSPTFLPQNYANPAPVQAQTPSGGVNTPSGFVCRPVTSRAEAEVYQIPFDGSTTYFVDTANGKIYSKTFNFNNGTAPLVTYVQEGAEPVPQYVTADVVDSLRNEIESLKGEIETLKKPKKIRKVEEYEDE